MTFPATEHPPTGFRYAAPVPLWNIANILTMVRCVMVPVFVVVAALYPESVGGRSLAAAIFVVAMITDFLDGYLARSRNLITDFGKIVDPIADKALMGSALVCLSLLGELPWWVTVVILVREVGITLMRFVVIRRGVIPASRGGKLKTTLQAVGLILMLTPLLGLVGTLGLWVMYAALVVTVVTGVDYLVQALRLRQTSERAVRKRAERAERAARAAARTQRPRP